MPEKNISLKDQLFNAEKLNKIAGEIEHVYTAFESRKFIEACLSRFPALELKERISCISEELEKQLPKDYASALHVLISSLPSPCDPNLSDHDYGDFIYASYSNFVVNFGCTPTYVELSLDALEAITTRFSAEYAVRDFINRFPVETFTKLEYWSKHPHYHVRRLASEGTRPKLPWGKNIATPMEQALPILDTLHADRTRFVTRSVANHLNDIAKTQPDLVLKLLKNWRETKKQTKEELDFITKHAVRTLIKKGNSNALRLIGFENSPKIKIDLISFSKSVKLNGVFNFAFELTSMEKTNILIDYGIHFQTNTGIGRRAKIYKLKQITMVAGQRVLLEKNHQMRANMTTRKLYSGMHEFILQVNGRVLFRAQFDLSA